MKKLLLLTLILLISACSSPSPKFYQPVVTKTSNITYDRVNGTILLQQLLLPAEVSRPQITTIGQNDFELKIDEFNRWGASPDKLFQRIIAEDLIGYLPNANVELQTPLRKNYKYAVAVEITNLSGKLGDTAALGASYFIKNKNGAVIKSGRLNESVALEGSYNEYVLAQSRLLGALAAQIAADLSQL